MFKQPFGSEKKMPESALQNIDKRFESEVARRTSSAYSNKFLINTPPIVEVSSGSGNIEGISQSQNTIRNLLRVVTRDQEGRVIFSSWPKIEDSLTQSDLLESEEKELQKLIYQVKTSPIRCREKLANRLNTLFKDSKEEYPYGAGISTGSLRSFINFLKLHLNIKCPSISLTPEYNIYASWRDEQNRVFSVHFLPNGDARFVIFKPNYKHPERKIRISGTTTTDILMETVSPHKISDWVLE